MVRFFSGSGIILYLQLCHGSVTIKFAFRAVTQRSRFWLFALNKDLDISPKTVAKWRKLEAVEDIKVYPKEPCSTVQTQSAWVVAQRRRRLIRQPEHVIRFAHHQQDTVKTDLRTSKLQRHARVEIHSICPQ